MYYNIHPFCLPSLLSMHQSSNLWCFFSASSAAQLAAACRAARAMVEGDGCHRIAAEHRKSLVGRKMQAKSPNGRFKGGALAIMKCGGVLTKIEVHGKNMFYFFGQGSKVVVVHVHFGLAGVALKIETKPNYECCLLLRWS